MAAGSEAEEFTYRVLIETTDPATLSTFVSTLEGYRGNEIVDEEVAGAEAAPDQAPPPGSVIAYFAADTPDAAPDLCKRLKQQVLDQLSFAVELLECRLYTDESWREEWKAFFDPVEIAPTIWVGPPWEEETLDQKAGESGTALVIDPGMAFGTGHHETTRLSARLLAERLAESTDEKAPHSVLDVGCGSGVLSMLAAERGAEPIVGIDISEDAIDAARENARVNGLDESLDLSTRPLEAIDAEYDIVVANILAGVLLELGGELYRHVAPGGRLIVSGIMTDEREAFLADFLRKGWQVARTLTEGEWVAFAIVTNGGTCV